MKFNKILPQEEGSEIPAKCPICDATYQLNTNWNAREGHLCPSCTASGRSQAIAYLVSKFLFENKLPLVKQKKNRDIKLIGLSDGQVYAHPLSKICDYTNSYFHKEPFLDITAPLKGYWSGFDGLISADVFEHVLTEPCQAFSGAYKIIKPGGCLILTVPFVNHGDHKEHYPGISGYEARQENGSWIADIQYRNGKTKTITDPKFHGGPGKTLEVRLFNRNRLLEELKWAGFDDIYVMDENLPEHGINWSAASRPIVAIK